jgi:hypothetical protein
MIHRHADPVMAKTAPKATLQSPPESSPHNTPGMSQSVI